MNCSQPVRSMSCSTAAPHHVDPGLLGHRLSSPSTRARAVRPSSLGARVTSVTARAEVVPRPGLRTLRRLALDLTGEVCHLNRRLTTAAPPRSLPGLGPSTGYIA